MTITNTSAVAELVALDETLFSRDEQAALAGSSAGYSGLTRDAYTLDRRQYTSWCTLRGLLLFAARRVDIETFRGDARGRRSLAGCASSPGSAATASRKSCSIIPPQPMSADRGWTTTHTPPPRIATSSARCSWPPGSGRRKSRP